MEAIFLSKIPVEDTAHNTHNLFDRNAFIWSASIYSHPVEGEKEPTTAQIPPANGIECMLFPLQFAYNQTRIRHNEN